MTAVPPRRRRRIGFERRVLLLALLAGLPGVATAILLLWTGDFSARARWTMGSAIVLAWTWIAASLRARVVFPLQTMSNLLAAQREGDFSSRARGERRDDALGELMHEVNALATTLQEQRLDALEATTLLRKIMEEIDVAVFALDGAGTVRLVNRAGERLLGRPAERLLGHAAAEVGLGDFLVEAGPRVVERVFPGGAGRWEIRSGTFRQGGLPLRMLVVSDLSRALREEERQAWQRLIRVLGHELNNSLAPIRSIAASLATRAGRAPRAPDWEDDLRSGLGVISARAESLARFMNAYARLARLPAPRLAPVDLGRLVRRVAGLETRIAVEVQAGPETTLPADGDQLEQLVINVIRNAADAALETRGRVRVGWRRAGGHCELWVEDDGPGLPETSNLFVPFFTTKPGGSGIGLVLSRQIAEAHGGTLLVRNRAAGQGCEALLRLPLRAA